MCRWKICSFIFLFSSFSANAQYYSSGANPTTVESISVEILDSAIEGCWTNLREVREYAEEKLRIAGYEVESNGGEYSFGISVNAFRLNGREECVGAIGVQIYSSSTRRGVFGFHEIGNHGGVYIKPGNLNNDVLEMVNSVVRVM
jgi:hypothetical protein